MPLRVDCTGVQRHASSCRDQRCTNVDQQLNIELACGRGTKAERCDDIRQARSHHQPGENRRIHGVLRTIHNRKELPSPQYGDKDADDSVCGSHGDQLQNQLATLGQVLNVICARRAAVAWQSEVAAIPPTFMTYPIAEYTANFAVPALLSMKYRGMFTISEPSRARLLSGKHSYECPDVAPSAEPQRGKTNQ